MNVSHRTSLHDKKKEGFIIYILKYIFFSFLFFTFCWMKSTTIVDFLMKLHKLFFIFHFFQSLITFWENKNLIFDKGPGNLWFMVHFSDIFKKGWKFTFNIWIFCWNSMCKARLPICAVFAGYWDTLCFIFIDKTIL